MQQTLSIANAVRRVFSALAFVWLAQFGIALWFMIGQGYDRATADLVPIAGLGMVPVFAWLLRSGLPNLAGSKAKRIGMAMLYAVALYLIGLIVPAQAVLHGFPFTSPFDELWWLLGSATAVTATILAYTKGWARAAKAGSKGLVMGVLILLGSGVSVPLWRVFVFSFFG